MKILVYSPLFYPSIGGLETIIATLAHEFTCQGHEVKLISQILTKITDTKQFTFDIIRQPNNQELLKLVRWCDVYFHACVSLKSLWPLLFVPRSLVISHHTWYRRDDGSKGWQDYLKQLATHFATNISVSNAISKTISAGSIVIPNSYQDNIFCELPKIERDRDLVFLGRLVSDKGINLLISALAQLKSRGLTPNLTIIGSGPEETNLCQQAKELGVFDQVNFVGVKLDQTLAELLNTHKIMVVPSLWEEPFGIVALEGIACGCVIVGSVGGGLKDAIGGCGVTFPNGNVDLLTNALYDLLLHSEQLEAYRQNSPSHLARHTSKAVADEYLKVLEAIVK
jgi:glycogen synthase